ncbi:MAG: hypothetical protein U0R19_41160 [Bryobacteraceae bacterium]
MKRLWVPAALAAMCCMSLVLTTPATAQSGPRLVGVGPQGTFDVSAREGNANRPGLIDPNCGLVGGPAVGSASCDSQSGREWEGLASTDYFTFEPPEGGPNPDIAVGPDDIVTIINGTIARYPNPNAPSSTNSNGNASVAYNPANTYYFPPTSRQFLDVWLGEVALNELCPTQPRTRATCVIDNGTIRYDQMQGRFVVLFTVVDNGQINCFGCIDSLPAPPQQGPIVGGQGGQGGQATGTSADVDVRGAVADNTRKASWVLIVSKWATGCQGSIALGSGGSNVGGVCTPNTNPAVAGLVGNTEFFTTPQPPGPNQSNPNSGGANTNWIVYYGATDGTCESPCSYGNINSISDRRRGQAAPAGAVTIDCRNTAVGGGNVCYLPTSARIGLDNDNIYIVSSVINDNISTSARTWANPATEGTRLRVHKKAGFYTGVSSVPGANSPLLPGAAQAVVQLQGDFYDLWGNSTRPYAFDQTVVQDILNGGQRTVFGLHYEPEHVRGRALATFSGNANVSNAFYAIWGAVDQGYNLATPAQNLLYHRTITYTRMVAGDIGVNTGNIPATVNNTKIQGGIPTLQAYQSHQVPAFTNPNSVSQKDKLVQPNPNNVLPTPYIYVGDDRPHRVISREGHRYIARVGTQSTFRFDGTSNYSTVIYDIVQKLSPNVVGKEIYNTAWGNGRFYAPMFDTPANVVQYGAISPINVQPFLEKLFVGTTFPPLAPTDPRTFSYGLISGQSLISCKGQEPGTSTSNSSYPGLFDMRCGEDAYDTVAVTQHATTGSYTTGDFQVSNQPTGFAQQIVPFPIRGGAATDPNNMGFWAYGAYAKGRLASVPGYGQWGTYVAHYPLTFPLRDPYNNSVSSYSDVPPGHPFFTYIQIAKQTEIDPGSRTSTAFTPDGTVLRRDMAKWVVRSQMDEGGITNYLNSTGGIFCSFADVQCPGTGGVVTDTTGATEWRYIELMFRRGYTKGCNATTDAQRRFCPGDQLSRGQMSAFIIRAKMNSVFPTVTSGAATASCLPTGTAVTQVGDQFGLYAGCTPYFSDVPNNHTFFAFIQKMRELRI